MWVLEIILGSSGRTVRAQPPSHLSSPKASISPTELSSQPIFYLINKFLNQEKITLFHKTKMDPFIAPRSAGLISDTGAECQIENTAAAFCSHPIV